MLPGVLLHVVEAPFPVDLAIDMGSWSKWTATEMPDHAVIVLLDLFHAQLLCRIVVQTSAQLASIEGLASAGGIESGAVERELPYRLAICARHFANHDDGSVEPFQKRIGIIEARGLREGEICR